MAAPHNLNGSVDLEHTWRSLESGLQCIVTAQGLSRERYMSLYTDVYHFCTHQRTKQALSRDAANFIGTDLYNNLTEYLGRHLAILRTEFTESQSHELLKHYIRLWSQYKAASKTIDHLFQYLNRFWVKREMVAGRKGIYDVYTLTITAFRKHFLSYTHKEFIAAVMEQIKNHRDGVETDVDLLRGVLESLVELGLDDADSKKSQLDIYQQYFETTFLDETYKYFKIESERFMSKNPVTEYMKRAELRLNEERMRCEAFLHPTSRRKVLSVCENVLIEDHHGVMVSEIQELLDTDKTEDLSRMYRLLVRIPRLLTPLRDLFERHVRATGLAAVDRLFATESDSTQNDDAPQEGETATVKRDTNSIEPRDYVDTLLKVHGKYSKLCKAAFAGEAGFVAALDKACREFVNRRDPKSKSGSSRSPELLARFCDSILRKSAKSYHDHEVEELSNNIMKVFKYIEEKDVFQKFYSRMLSRRLVYQISASDDNEANMIGKLKEACGFEYTSKLQRMFTDIGTSKSMNQEFEAYCKRHDISDSTEFSMNVLSTAAWPLSPPNAEFNIPEDLSGIFKNFSKFYEQKHSGRKLTWLFQWSRGEIRAHNFKSANGKPTTYTFQVSLYQMAVLLLFNKFSCGPSEKERNSLSYNNIGEDTGLTGDSLESAMYGLLKSRVLVRRQDDDLGDRVGVNKGFKSKRVRVNLNITSRSEGKVEAEETHKNVEEDRRLLIQAAIVRIMKTRKTMKHVALVQEVISQLTPRFRPRVPDIKKSIDVLLEKEYIERQSDQRDVLNYVA